MRERRTKDTCTKQNALHSVHRDRCQVAHDVRADEGRHRFPHVPLSLLALLCSGDIREQVHVVLQQCLQHCGGRHVLGQDLFGDVLARHLISSWDMDLQLVF